jgi:fructose-1,6-bisphosphatase I
LTLRLVWDKGEDQKKLDILANEVFVNVLRKSGQCFALISEEDDEPTIITGEDRGEYGVVFDPLDGSSNIDCGVSIGTIFGVYKRPDGTDGCVDDVLRVRICNMSSREHLSTVRAGN